MEFSNKGGIYMAKFTTHIVVSAGVSGFVATSLLAADAATPQQTAWYFSAGIIGGLLPDIDYKDSLLLKIIFAFCGVALATWIVYFWFIFIWSFFEQFFVWMAVFLVVYYGLYNVFTEMTDHRGMFHSVPASFFFGALTVYVLFWVFHYSPFFSWAVGFMVWLGYLIHLILDEIFKVNLEGEEIKDHKFGTALKFYSAEGNIWLTVFLYLATILMFWRSPNPTPFFRYLVSPKHYSTWGGRSFPNQGWFIYRPGTNFYVPPGPPRSPQAPIRDPYQPGRYKDGRYQDER